MRVISQEEYDNKISQLLDDMKYDTMSDEQKADIDSRIDALMASRGYVIQNNNNNNNNNNDDTQNRDEIDNGIPRVIDSKENTQKNTETDVQENTETDVQQENNTDVQTVNVNPSPSQENDNDMDLEL